jgi:hypothetical protein
MVPDNDPEMGVAASTKDMLRIKIEHAITDKPSSRPNWFSKDRAERIADYETKYVFHRATLLAFRQRGKVDAVRWMSDDASRKSAPATETSARSRPTTRSRRATTRRRHTPIAGAGSNRPIE